jgi:hypothetical protein
MLQRLLLLPRRHSPQNSNASSESQKLKSGVKKSLPAPRRFSKVSKITQRPAWS